MSLATSRFTQPEWHLVRDAPLLAGLAVSAMDYGLVSFAREMTAVTRTLMAARDQYERDTLIASVVQDAAVPEERFSQEMLTPEDILVRLGCAGAIVDQKAPEHAAAYKQLLVDVAESAARAADAFASPREVRGSDAKQHYLEDLRALLGHEPGDQRNG